VAESTRRVEFPVAWTEYDPGVLGVVVPEDPAAGGQDHRPVVLDQGAERGLVAVGSEPGQEVVVGWGRRRQPPEHLLDSVGGHVYLLCPVGRTVFPTFCRDRSEKNSGR
jgi:hypothetical protein